MMKKRNIKRHNKNFKFFKQLTLYPNYNIQQCTLILPPSINLPSLLALCSGTSSNVLVMDRCGLTDLMAGWSVKLSRASESRLAVTRSKSLGYPEGKISHLQILLPKKRRQFLKNQKYCQST